MSTRYRAGVTLLLMLSAAPTYAAETCDLDLGDLVSYAIQYRAYALGLADEPLQSPPSSQSAATTGAAADDSVPDASFPALFAMNLGVPTSSTDSGALTFNLTPFALVAARNSDVISDQSQYAKYDSLRRIGVALTLGGRGEAFDRDGDGKINDALESQDKGDIVSFEARYRFFGSRDRRDAVNEDKYFEAIGPAFDLAGSAFATVARDLSSAAQAISPQANGKYCQKDSRKLAAENASLIDPQVKNTQQYLDARKSLLEQIDGATIWTAVAGATEQKEQFGPDRWWFGIRGAGGMGPDMGWTATLDYGKASWAQTEDDTKRIKAGVEWASLVGKKWVAPEQGGIRASLSAAYEKWTNVPGAKDDKVASVNFKLQYPLTDTIFVPISLTWVNKTDLLKDKSEIRGYVGFTFDFDGALRKALELQ